MAKCVVHYEHIDASPRVVPLDNDKFQTLWRAKEVREILGGENHHPDQCSTVPGTLHPATQGAHTECYKKFTYAITTAKKRIVLQDISNVENKRVRRTGEGSSQIFPDHCMICKSPNEIKHKVEI